MSRRTAWMLDLMLLTLGALLLAYAANGWIGVELAPPLECPIALHSVPEQHVTPSLDGFARLFPRSPATTRPTQESARLDPTLRLLATTVSPRADWSLALVDDGAHVELRAPGDQLSTGTIGAIGPGFAIIHRAEGDVRLELSEGPSNAQPASNPTARGPLTRAQLAALIANPAPLLTQARFIPAADGIRVAQLQPDSLFAQLGLRNGDVVRSIEGTDATNLVVLMQRIPELLRRDRVSVELQRDGAPNRLLVEVRD